MSTGKVYSGLVILIVALGMLITGCTFAQHDSKQQSASDVGQLAMEMVRYQQNLGPRTPDSEGHREIIKWIDSMLEDAGCRIDTQNETIDDIPVTNLIGKKGKGESGTFILLGAHYDTRIYADHDPDPSKRTLPVPGANDGASGVAVLLALAHEIPDDYPGEIWFVFFDAEDNGEIGSYRWGMGAEAFVNGYLTRSSQEVDAVIIVDMIGDSDLGIYYEQNSDEVVKHAIWKTAADLGYQNYFISKPKYRMMDDHIPFLQKGYHAVDIIDFDYPYWHTTKDTLDKVSAESLGIVVSTLSSYLMDFGKYNGK